MAVTLPYFGVVPQVLLRSDLLFTTTRRFAEHYARMLPLVIAEPPLPFPSIRCYGLTPAQPDRPTDLAWLLGLLDTVSAELTRSRRRRAGPG